MHLKSFRLGPVRVRRSYYPLLLLSVAFSVTRIDAKDTFMYKVMSGLSKDLSVSQGPQFGSRSCNVSGGLKVAERSTRAVRRNTL